MNWFNFSNTRIRSEQFAESTDVQLGVWFRLIVYCCEQENGGSIPKARDWSDRQWLAVGVSREAINEPSPLWKISPLGSLIIADYPAAKVAEIQAKREAGKKTAKKRWGPSKVVPMVRSKSE